MKSRRTKTPGSCPLREPGQTVTAEYLERGALRYSAEDGDIVGRNGTYFNNRPLYCEPGTEGVVLAGDRPLVRLLAEPFVLGAFCAAIVRGGKGIWLHACAEVEARYRCGRMTWRIRDTSLPGALLALHVAPMKGAAGFVLRLEAQGLASGDRLVWAFGGATTARKDRAFGFWLGSLREQWDPVYRGNPNVCKTGDPRKPELGMGFVPEWCRANRAVVDGQVFRLSPPCEAGRHATGRCDRAGRLFAADAAAAGNPVLLSLSAADKLPIVCGELELLPGKDQVFWAVEAMTSDGQPSPRLTSPAGAYAEALADLEATERVRIRTPEPRLDAALGAVCHAIDGACDRDPFLFRHGCMAWSCHFLGWRVICGATALTWHDRVKGTAAHYLATQSTDDPVRTGPCRDDGLGCVEGSLSRLFGRGRIEPERTQSYDMQSQFFDQLLREWRWTADPELERMLAPALELHLEWARACFDPDDDGLYESYINTLPTDCVWYNGAGSVEESAYAYYGHRAAEDMARRAGDEAGAARHAARAGKIRQALRELLWLKDRGHFGLYLEQGGHRRVHADAWVYSQFLPVDAGLLAPEEAAQALHYTEWGLERIRLPFGGTLCQPSNWVPSKWSVRDMFGGDLCHHALAYFQAGLADEGWELLHGAQLESCYASAVPGGFSHIGAGTDFADNSHMFARTVIEGLFGFDPDYPNGLVLIRPAFPSAWPTASIDTPDFSLSYRQEGDTGFYRLTLARPAAVEFRLPVSAEAVERVMVNGNVADWSTRPGFGRTTLLFGAARGTTFDVAVATTRRVRPSSPEQIAGTPDGCILLPSTVGTLVRWLDPQGALHDAHADPDGIHARLTGKTGHFLVLTEVMVGTLPRWHMYKLRVSEPAAATGAAPAQRRPSFSLAWHCLDLKPHLNGDICKIFKQAYLSPRPDTCSVRLGTDGYSAWTMRYWKEGPPVIDLGNLLALADPSGGIRTPQGALFAVSPAERNIAFTSLWDNWPTSVTTPVGRAGQAIWMLLCGSTFPMQTGIANAELRFLYADGVTERLELIPPVNFWSLCPWGGVDYSYETDAFCLPPEPPPQVQLGENCRAMVLEHRLREGVELIELTLETLSQDVVIGLMAASLMK